MAKRNGGIIGPSNVPTGQYGGTASGVWRLRDAFNYIKAGLWPVFGTYPVGNSLRFNSGSSDYLSKTFSASNRKTFTISFWLKRSALTANQGVISGYQDGSNLSSIYLPSANSIQYYNYVNAGFPCNVSSSALFRDVSAWYHVVLVYDSTQATSTDRVKLYVNGSQSTLSGTFPSLNDDSWINSANPITIGKEGPYSNYLSAYLADFYSIDGQALTPSSFGQTDSATGIWTPSPYTGTFGTNGFFLKFANSAALGTDSSGNGNTFTVNNLTSIDQSTDTPTNNFSTMNPLRQPTGNPATLTNGNLTVATNTSAGYYGGRSTIGVSSGKWYFEAKLVSYDTLAGMIGIGNADNYEPEMFSGGQGAFAGYSATGWSYNVAGSVTNNNTDTAYGNSFAAGDILSVALDCDNAKLYFGKNGTWQNSGVPTSGATGTGAISITSGLTYLFAVDDSGSTRFCVWDCNFGSPPYSANSYTDGAGYGNFSYAVPSGYYSLNTKNLANFG
jgi:hypothetical protein